MMSKKRKRYQQYIRQKFPKRMQKKLVLLFMAIVLAFAGLIGNITKINLSKGEQYTKIVLNQQQYDSKTIPFRRGDIVDRNGTVLATSERVYNVILDAKVMLASDKETVKNDTIAQVKQALKLCFGIEESRIDEIIATSADSPYNVLEKKVSYEKAKELEELQEDEENYPYIGSCIWLEEEYQRTYPYNALACDVIGFTVAGNVGNSGMELSYNSVLNGTDGRKYGYQEDSTVEYTVKEPVNGNQVVSTIDIALQSIVEKHIIAFNEEHKDEETEGNGSKNTAVIIMDPNTGEILAEASYPNYDLNDPRNLSEYYTEKEWEAKSSQEKLDAMNQLWRNFCVSDSFEPGSTAKTFTIAGGLEDGSLKGNESYLCAGKLKVGGIQNISCHKLQGHGMQNLSQAIANSCNVALMYTAQAIGAEGFCKYQEIFNLGKLTGIDLPGESTGLVFQPENMGPLELATSSFGQGFNVTMTQMVAAYASVINGGNYYEPHVVKQILDEDGNVVENKDPVLVKKTISEETSKTMREYMRKTMTEGTGRNAQLEGYDIGAKTGTAEKLPRRNGKHVLSYMGFAPVDDPEVLIFVVIDEANVKDQSVSKYVTDLSREIMEEAFPYLNITKAE